LERFPTSVPQQFHRRSVSSIAIGFTALSPLIFVVVAYLWASFVADKDAASHEFSDPRSRQGERKLTHCEMSILGRWRK
jgi:hypothetical protein